MDKTTSSMTLKILSLLRLFFFFFFYFEQAKQVSPVRYVFLSREVLPHYVLSRSQNDLYSTAIGSSKDDLGSATSALILADLTHHSEYNLILFQQAARLSASFRHS